MKSHKLLGALLAVVGCTVGGVGCSSSAADDVGATEGAATVNAVSAKVSICDDDENGCAKCDEKIGDYQLTADEREACTLKALRGGLRDRITFLISEAGRRGLFLRTTNSADTPVKLLRIKVIPDTGSEKNEKSQYTRLSGSFVVGENPDKNSVKGGVSVYSVTMPVRLAFEFEDKSGTVVHHEQFVMENAYNLIPFFYMKAELAVNLNIGGILSKFGGGPVAAALLSALGGEANLHVDAAHELRWSTPVCADSVDDRSKQSKNHYRAFDNDFMKNVFLPMCKTYQRDTDPNVKCWDDAEGDTSTLLQRTADLSSRPLLAAESCVRTDAPWFDSNTFKVDFVAPAKWGFAPGQDAYLYQRNASVADVWKRYDDVTVIGVDGQTCGRRALKEGEVCVHAKIKHAFFEDECAQIQNTGSRMFGVSQIDAEDTDQMIQYKLP